MHALRAVSRFSLRLSESKLNGYSALVANRKAPAEAENTEAFSADLMPVPAVIPIPNAKSSHPLSCADKRV